MIIVGLQVCVFKLLFSVFEVYVVDVLICNVCNCDDSICNVKVISEEVLLVYFEGKKYWNKVKVFVGKVIGFEIVDQEIKLVEINVGRNKLVL